MNWHTKAGNITTSYKVKVDFTLPALSAKNAMTWKCHVDDSANCGYGMILGRDIWTELGLNSKFSVHVIKSDDGTFEGSTTPMVDLGTYIFKDLNTGKITLEEFLLMLTLKKYMGQNMHVLIKLLRVILDAKHEK